MRWISGIALCLVLTVGSASGWAADQVRTRGWGYADYGRLVFDWPASVQYSAKIENGSLVVRFERPMTSNFASALGRLGDYVSGGNLSADGLVATFTLTGEFTVRPFANGTSVVVDLRRQKAGDQAASGKSATVAEEPLPPLRVRVGQHPGYTRLVFDWTRSVQYTVSRQDTVLRLKFNRPARIDAAKVQRSLPEGIANIAGNIDAGALLVRLNLPSDSRVRHFRSGTKVVLDVVKGAGEAKVEAAPPPKASVAVKAPPPPVVAAVTTTAAEVEVKAEAEAEAEEAVSQATSSEVVQPQQKTLQENTAQDTSSESSAGPTRLVRREEQPQPAVSVQPQQIEATAAVEVASAAVAEQTAAAPASQPVVAATGQKAVPVSLVFEWPESTGAAIFKRAGFTWIIFD